MKRHTIIFFAIITIFVIYAIVATYNRSFNQRDFILVDDDDQEIDAATLEPVE